ncbi:DUF397 domain-containing protein [Nocardia amamiensis]|uniref:DUF397 domain-containing protein n=1 Tax=Nocardia amamiensis TaxID=404578 RepID=UPI00082F7FAF|nr:DUF397 domain-containing protein [Nocardia amamiensis]
MTTRLRHGWQKSSYSNNGGASCVEVNFAGETILLRDSKYLRDPSNDPAGQPIIVIEAESWPVFLNAAAGLATDPARGIPSIKRTPDGGAVVRAVDGTALVYTCAEWHAFVAGIRAGEFSLIAA